MTKFWKSGSPYIWLTGGAVALSLLMIAGLFAIVLVNGLRQFWPSEIVQIELKNGKLVLGEIWEREEIPSEDTQSSEPVHRLRVKTGNRDLYTLDFRWIDEADIAGITRPEEALVIERAEWGNFYGFFAALQHGERVVSRRFAEGSQELNRFVGLMDQLHGRIADIEHDYIGNINYQLEKLRLEIRKIKTTTDTTRADGRRQLQEKRTRMRTLNEEYLVVEDELAELYAQARQTKLTVTSVDGRSRDIDVFNIVRFAAPNNMNILQKSGLYANRIWEYLSGEPRESNTEGGVFPAIFGTVMLVIIMSIAVVPLGVLAAIYLREYAKQGFWVSLIRIAVNNLAGVPSIVYGVFGLGFFIYTIGGSIDQLFYSESLPTPTFGTGGILWASLTLALLTVPVVIVATEEGLAAVPREIREGSLALAATKFETLRHIVIPSAMPGILTGLILAIARAAGEVAPLMITGVVKLAPSLPLDGRFPFLHLERKFMHLGFHIYDVGFQSPNVEAAIPMVYSTTLLLILIVVLLNIVAIVVRNHLRKKLAFSAF